MDVVFGLPPTEEGFDVLLTVRYLSKHLQTYIEHCPDCQLNQTRRHRPYGSMIPIYRPGIPFHTITMDFIPVLPITSKGFDCILVVT